MTNPEHELQQAERKLCTSLPDEVRAFVLTPASAEPEGRWYQYWQDKAIASSWVEAFRVLTPRDNTELGLTDLAPERRKDIPPDMVSIGVGPGGQEILVACGSARRGSVWMKDFPSCSQLNSPAERLYFVAPNFTSFLAQLSGPDSLRPPFPPMQFPASESSVPGLAPLPTFTRNLLLIEPLAQGYDLVDEGWRQQYIKREWCRGCTAILANADFSTPIQLRREPRRKFSGARPFLALHSSIMNALRPFLERAVVRPITVAGTQSAEWVCLHYEPHAWLECDRGRFAQHKQCPSCGAISREAMHAHPVVLARDLDDRQLYLSQFNELLMTREAVEQSGLETLLPGVKMHTVPIVDHSLSAEVLPGDFGWTGRLGVVRPPEVPETLERTSYGRYL